MKVTKAVREYVTRIMNQKVAARKEKAEKAFEELTEARKSRIRAVKAFAERQILAVHEKVVKEAKRLGLTWIPDETCWDGGVKDRNVSVKPDVDSSDFVETTEYPVNQKRYPSPVRDEYVAARELPGRIQRAAEAATDKLLFELELGKVAKQELDGILDGLEVKL